jgi:hypothetical protein
MSGFGILIFLVGSGYWLWYFLHQNRVRVMLRNSPWSLVGNLTVVGMLVIAIGRTLVELARRHGH